jgi:hypothetical protein
MPSYLVNIRQVPRLLQPFAAKVPIQRLTRRQRQDLAQNLATSRRMLIQDSQN